MLATRNHLAAFPQSTEDDSGIYVTLEKVKQGTYASLPATFLIFKAEMNPSCSFKVACLEIRLTPLSRQWFAHTSSNTLRVGAYGPAHITEWPEGARMPGDLQGMRPASIKVSATPRGAMLILHAGDPEQKIVPLDFMLGVVVIHNESAQLSIIPSTGEYQRLKAFRRTRIFPLDLALTGDLGATPTTCAHQGEGGGCHSTCDDFGPEHMTPAIWRELLARRQIRNYVGNSPTTVSGPSYIRRPLNEG